MRRPSGAPLPPLTPHPPPQSQPEALAATRTRKRTRPPPNSSLDPPIRSRRTAALLHSGSVSIYLGAARLLERILARAPIGDPSLLAELQRAVPPFWAAAARDEAAAGEAAESETAVVVASGEAEAVAFPGVQGLLLRGLARPEARAACLRLMRHSATARAPQRLLEHERTRLITATAALVRWLCASFAQPAEAPPREAAAATAAGGGGGGGRVTACWPFEPTGARSEEELALAAPTALSVARALAASCLTLEGPVPRYAPCHAYARAS